jgi:hypothetical protein
MCEVVNKQSRAVLPCRAGASTGALVVLLALAVAVLTTGCRSTKNPYSNRMASIVVTNQPSDQIEAALQTVFKNHGYEEGKADGDELVFQKQGSIMSGVVYGDWYSGGVWERIKIYQRALDSARTVVECDGYMVQEHEDPLFQKEKREYGTKKGHLRDLLNEVAKELKNPTPAPAPPPAAAPLSR